MQRLQVSESGARAMVKCTDHPAKAGMKGDVEHDHTCGCTKCWKQQGAMFSVVAVVPRDRNIFRKSLRVAGSSSGARVLVR